MTSTVDDISSTAGNEGSAPSMDEGAATDGQAATPGMGRPDSAAGEGEGGDAAQEAPERAAAMTGHPRGR